MSNFISSISYNYIFYEKNASALKDGHLAFHDTQPANPSESGAFPKPCRMTYRVTRTIFASHHLLKMLTDEVAFSTKMR